VPLRLEPAEFNLLWTRLGLPAKPVELNVPKTPTEAPRLPDQLRARALLLGDDPAPGVAGLLTAVAHPSAQVDLRWTNGADPELRGLVALRGRTGVLAVWTGESVTVRRVRHTVFAEELAALLGESAPGTGHSVTAPAETLLKASQTSAGDAERFQHTLVANGLSRPDARTWRAIAEARRVRAGQIGATAFDQWGKPTRAPWAIHVFDTDRGRYATYERGGYRTVVGVRTSWLVTVIQELYTDAVRPRRNP
jgi:ESX secretion-associated protein EspG